MKEVEVSGEFAAPREKIAEKLTPRSIIEYEETFDIHSVTQTDDGCLVTVTNEDVSGDITMNIAFVETENGYRYEQVGGGVFDELYTEIAIEEGDTVQVTVRSRFTFGGLFAVVKDWFGESLRNDEIERLLFNLAHDLEDVDDGDELRS